jgi:hypothetical protein
MFIFITIITLVIYIKWHDAHFVEKNFKLYTQIEIGYVKKLEFYDDNESFFEVILSNNQKRFLKQRFNFTNELIYTTQVPCKWITQNDNYQYYFYSNHAGFRYVLFALEKNGNDFIVYQDFGDN